MSVHEGLGLAVVLIVSVQDFVRSLSVLARGSLSEKLQWTFSLYDLDGDGVISRDELEAVVASIYAIMGRYAAPPIDHQAVLDHVDRVFKVLLSSLLTLLLDGVYVILFRIEFRQFWNTYSTITTSILLLLRSQADSSVGRALDFHSRDEVSTPGCGCLCCGVMGLCGFGWHREAR